MIPVTLLIFVVRHFVLHINRSCGTLQEYGPDLDSSLSWSDDCHLLRSGTQFHLPTRIAGYIVQNSWPRVFQVRTSSDREGKRDFEQSRCAVQEKFLFLQFSGIGAHVFPDGPWTGRARIAG